jgi:hypothetical protein
MESRHILDEMRPFVQYYKCLGEPIGWMPRLWNDGAAARSMFPTNRYFYQKVPYVSLAGALNLFLELALRLLIVGVT